VYHTELPHIDILMEERYDTGCGDGARDEADTTGC
jgi:hypothetical protein